MADWRREDYENAARENDPQLIAAVNYAGEHFADRRSVADFLVRLLDPSQSSAATNVRLIEAVVAAEAANGTPRAREILAGLVNGTIPTADPPSAAVVTLRAVVARQGPGATDLLLRALAARPGEAGRGPGEAADNRLRSAAFALLRSSGSEPLWDGLVKSMLATKTSAAEYEDLWSVLQEPRQESLPAQVLLYQSERLDPAKREVLEPRIGAGSGAVLRRLLGIPASSSPAVTSLVSDSSVSALLASEPLTSAMTASRPVAIGDSLGLADRLWTPAMADVLDQRLGALETLDKGGPLIPLAVAVPRASVRASLLRTLQRHWDEGPKGLKTLCASDSVTVDPGLIAALKVLRRDEVDDSSPAADALVRNAGRRALKSPSRNAADPLNGPRPETLAPDGTKKPDSKKFADLRLVRERQELVGREWMRFSLDVVHAACRQLCAAGRANPIARSGGDGLAERIDLPLEIDPQARVAVAYRLDWPETLDGKMAAPPLLRLRYVRLEQKATFVHALAYYRRRVPEGEERSLTGDAWIDSLAVVKGKNVVRSIDVLVTKASKSVLGLANQEQELTVEILTVECDGIAKPSVVSASR